MKSVRTQLDNFDGRGPGFDVARLCLSLTILCWHSVVTSYGHDAEIPIWHSPAAPMLMALMPMFFGLSGFLVMGSYVRVQNLRSFLALRALRIAPALLTAILISAFILGTLITVAPPGAYFKDPLFLKYFGSLFGKVSFVLPGVFIDNPEPNRVNSSLWTIAPELACYAYLGVQLALRCRRTGLTATAGILLVANIAMDAAGMTANLDDGVIIARHLVVCFAFGNLLFLWRDFVPFRLDLFALCFLVGIAFLRTTFVMYFSMLAFVYVIIYMGCTPLKIPHIFTSGDYSYGIYLYAFPVQQTFSYLFPSLREFYWNILFCAPATFLVAVGSWWMIERPALSFRRILHRFPPSTTDHSPFWMMSASVIWLATYGAFITTSSGMFWNVHLRYALLIAGASGLITVLLRMAFLSTRGNLLPRTPP